MTVIISNRILILEHEKKSSRLIIDILRKCGLEVKKEVVTDCSIDKITALMPHVIIVNSFDDENISLKVVKELKSDIRLSTVPIMVLLYGLNNNYKSQFIDLDIDDYLRFPFESNAFVHKINKLLKVGELQKQLNLSIQALEESLLIVNSQKKELDDNLTLAAKIQEALIPKTIGNIPNCSFEWKFKPSGKVGGDIFDVFMLDEEYMGLYMIDVMGHGVASSMLAVALSEFLITDVDRGSPLKRKTNTPPYYEILTPIQVVEYLNKRFPFTKYNHYFTIFYMVMNVKTGVIKYVRAAHPAPILFRINGEISELDAYGTPVGFAFKEGYEEGTINLDSGDNLVIYTDGLLEIEDENGKMISLNEIIKYLETEMQHNSHLLTSNLIKWISNKKVRDDLTVLEMKWVKFI
ncbi:SpoIIE family protein phosphatase [Serpentinicella alkaliphila]|uniref:Stage 0 sporulation protein A homolog n=1 Tax=Serpentinicella alkaliphila TaxID=1734049 RepID=A0A4R2TGA5_9FIRM|nr:SpoIIE family protein phosphatase [Serpentinicella alkaliphila]TCQ02620.1 sigma-B regulation protein RsbU (phosphoserine phosphatase) [Serpentinicella alkaliphila]